MRRKNGLLGVIMVVILTGALGWISNGFQNFDPEEWANKIRPQSSSEDPISDSEEPPSSEEPQVRQGLVTFDFVNSVSGQSLSSIQFIDFLSTAALPENPFTRVATYGELGITPPVELTSETEYFGNVFKDAGGLKLGSSSKLGYFSLYTGSHDFRYVNIIARNYTNFNSQTSLWSSDLSSVAVNDQPFQAFATNEADLTQKPPLQSKFFELATETNVLSFNTAGKRLIIEKIELWNSN